MAKKKQPGLHQSGFGFRKLDRYSVVMTLVIELVIIALISSAAVFITRNDSKGPVQTQPLRICSCPNIPAGANPADYCRC